MLVRVNPNLFKDDSNLCSLRSAHLRIKINRHFVSISRVMTLAAATTIDFEELRDGTSNENDGVIDGCYTTPSLRRDKWEVEPRPYRKKDLATKRDAYANMNDLDLVEHDDKNAHLATPDRTDLLNTMEMTSEL